MGKSSKSTKLDAAAKILDLSTTHLGSKKPCKKAKSDADAVSVTHSIVAVTGSLTSTVVHPSASADVASSASAVADPLALAVVHPSATALVDPLASEVVDLSAADTLTHADLTSQIKS